MIPLFAVSAFVRASLVGSPAIALETLALRHQLAVLQRSSRRPRLSRCDRIFWMWLSRCWAGWRSNLLIVQPVTVLALHRQGFQLYWLRAYLAYHNAARPHQALDENSPHPRSLEPPSQKRIVAIPHLGGLHHRYQRVA